AMLFGFSLLGLSAVLCFTLPLFQRKSHIPPKNQTVKPVLFNPSSRFEKNTGQTDPEVDFLCRGKNHILYLTSTGSVLQLIDGGENRRSVPLRMELIGANATSSAKGYDKLKSISNYYTGGDPDSWLTGVPNYARAGYDDVYPGIDMIYYFNGGNVEFDFKVKPGVDPKQIRLSFSSADRFKKDGNGNLAVSAGGHELVFHKPSAWQKLNGLKREVDVQFAVRDAGSVQFDIGPYDRSGTLTIDPQIIYATYLGGSKSDAGNGIAVDKYGCAYVTGSTSSTDFPKKNAYQSGLGSGSTYSDIFVTKMNPEGNDIIYSTYLGGRYNEGGDAIAVDTRCRACITGRTGSGAYDSTPESERFPLKNALRRITGDSQNAFVSVLDSTGGLFYSTYLGGEYEDWGEDIAVDASGCVYVTGTAFSYTPEFPIKNAFMSKKPSYYFDAFMTKIDPSKSGDESLVYSTYLGGDGDDYGYGIAVDGNGCAYVTGQATPNFPVKNAIQPEYKGKGDIFITKIDTKKSGAESLVYSTYLGDNASNSGAAIEVDASGCAYVSGSAAIPATPGTFSNTSSSFICKLNASGNGFVYLAHVLSGNCLALDADGNVYTVLITDLGKGRKVMALNADGTDTLFTQRTTVGTDLAVDIDGAVHVVGSTNAADLPTTNPYQKNLAGSYDAFVEKWNPKEMLVVKVLSDPVDQEPHPIRNTAVDVYSIDMSNPASPFAFLTRKTTDKKGLLKFPVGQAYQPGMPIFIRTTPERKPAVKLNRTDKTSCMYKVHVDNLDFDADGIVTARYLKPDSKDTTDMYMDHTSLAFSLVVS
ncbi:MAG TPA: SBBP repeat-containing protein, partial [bacterium]